MKIKNIDKLTLRESGKVNFQFIFPLITTLICLFVFLKIKIYLRIYHPEIPIFEFSYSLEEIIIYIVTLAPIFLLCVLFTIGIQLVFRSLTDKKPLTWGEKIFLMFFPLTLFVIMIVYEGMKIYNNGHPEIDYGKWVAIKYFVCVYTTAIILGAGPLATSFVLKKVFGFKIPMGKE